MNPPSPWICTPVHILCVQCISIAIHILYRECKTRREREKRLERERANTSCTNAHERLKAK